MLTPGLVPGSTHMVVISITDLALVHLASYLAYPKAPKLRLPHVNCHHDLIMADLTF
jgi:hypothetical protein